AVGKGGGPRRQPIRDRFDRSAGHAAVAGGIRRLRHPVDGGHLVSVRRISSQARTGALRSDRARSHARWAAIPRGSGSGWRQSTYAASAGAVAYAERQSQFSSEGPEGHGEMARPDARNRDAPRQADEAAGRGPRARNPPAR